MSKIGKAIFGGTDRSAQRNQLAQNEISRNFSMSQGRQAQDFLSGSGQQALQSAQAGFGGALDVMNRANPQQLMASQAGNIAAQNYLIGGMPQFQNALMGLPINYSQFQPTQIQYDPSVVQAQMPQQLQPQQQTFQQPMIPLGNMLGGQARY